MSDNEKSGSGQSQNIGKDDPALKAGLGKPKDKSHDFTLNLEAPQLPPPPKPQDKNTPKDK